MVDQKNQNVLVLGASPNESRYSYKALKMLTEHGFPILPYGNKVNQEVLGEKIIGKDQIPEVIDTITVYINPVHQEGWKDFILQTAPRRVIFNPGTENPDFQSELEKRGVEVVEACTLVLLSTKQF